MMKNNPDAIINTIFATGNNVPADGASMVSVMAQVTDSTGTTPLSGQSVVFTATGGAVIGSTAVTDTSGLATTTLTSTTAGVSSVTASVNNSCRSVDVTFTEVPQSPVISALVSDKDSIVNDGVDKAILTVTVTDRRTGNPVTGATITWSTTPGTIEPSTSPSNVDGLAIAALADTGDTGTAIVTASLDNGEEATCDISLVNSDAGWIISSLTSDKDSIVNNGTDTATLTATVIDSATGSIVSGAAVSWSTDSGTVSPATSATDENGLVTTQLSDTGDIGKATITASLGNGDNRSVSVSLNAAFFVTNAPSVDGQKQGSYTTYQTTNKLVVYGESGQSISAQCDDGATFTTSGTTQATGLLSDDGRIVFELVAEHSVSINCSVIYEPDTGQHINGTIDFTDFPFTDQLRLKANSGAPADGISANSVYFDSTTIHPASLDVGLSGSATFTDNSQQKTFDLTTPYDQTFDIINSVAETVTITCTVAGKSPITCKATFV